MIRPAATPYIHRGSGTATFKESSLNLSRHRYLAVGRKSDDVLLKQGHYLPGMIGLVPMMYHRGEVQMGPAHLNHVDEVLSERGAMFEAELLLASQLQPAGERKKELDDDDALAANVQLLYDSVRAFGIGDVTTTAIPPASRVQAHHVEQIVNQVVMRLHAESRIEPQISVGPVTILIPKESVATGLDRIEVDFTADGITVLLHFDMAPAGNPEQLLSAAAQLGQSLQDHLPGRRVRITQSSGAVDLDDDPAVTARPGSGIPVVVFSPFYQDGRS